jgi:hypothetical protein
MNVRNAKKPRPRVEVGYLSRFKLQSYGNDNLYPQHLQAITRASGTAELCLNRYAKFIEGYGFANEAISDVVVNHVGTTADELLHDIAQDVARFGGFALHVNYNVLCQVTEINFVPFENCRLEEEDDAGTVARILVHPDWTGKKTRNGHVIRVDESNIDRIDVFNPNPEVVAAQVIKAGGIDNYKGQILWVSLDGRFQYPTPIYDSVVTDISTDEGLGNIKYRNVRNNFLVSCMLLARKGVPKIDEKGNKIEEQLISDEDLLTFQGDENTSKILYVELENEEDKPEVVQFPTRNYDKEFSVTDASVVERIYAQFHQELFYSIRIGKLGFSGDVMRDAYQYYAGEVTNEQRFIERAFERICAHGALPLTSDFSIKPLKYISADKNDNV